MAFLKINFIPLPPIIFIGLILFMTSCDQYKDYKEKQKREHFESNFEAFQKLEQMQLKDINLIYGIRLDEASAKNISDERRKNISYERQNQYKNISDERRNEYQRLLKQARLYSFNYVSDQPAKRMVRFYERKGAVGSGYVYMAYPPPRFFHSFKEYKPIMPSESCFIILRKNWYMFSERFRLKQN